ncbi:MAG: archaeosine biosynthesis radical SAM protein RaSEA [Candidatus Methanospirare jalkutatii]|nr:archaeosine biosynthesis radical SAM protein RaSEA [Candidatus Methanospirare jalkutatii]
MRRKKAYRFSAESTRFWVSEDFFAEERRPVKTLTVILRTRGCSWRSCRMCGFWRESSPNISQEEIIKQLKVVLNESKVGKDGGKGEVFMLKIFTSGSFFDDAEISPETRLRMLRILPENCVKVIVETRPEFVSEEKVSECVAVLEREKGVGSAGSAGNAGSDFDFMRNATLEVAFGLETANDFIRNEYINKGFTLDDFKNAAEIVRECGAEVKVYLLLKPPFVSEREAIEDALRSAREVHRYASTFSLNLCNVQRGTFVERLWFGNIYRPPWLWSAVAAVERIKSEFPEKVVISDPVGAGAPRGPHNCGKCDSSVAKAIKKFNLTQDLSVFSSLECPCRNAWEELLKCDAFLFGAIPLR